MFFRRRRRAPLEEAVQFLMPRDVSWTAEDVFRLERCGDYAEALERWQVLLTPFRDPQIADRIADMKSHRVIWLHIGLCYRHLERYAEALEAYGRAEELARRARDEGMLAELHNSRGVVYRHQGQIERSLEELARALEAARRAGETSLEAVVHDNIAHCHRLRGRKTLALEEQRRAHAVFRSDPSAASAGTQGLVLANLGLMLVEAGRRAEGIALLEQGLEQSRLAGDLVRVASTTEILDGLR